MEDGERFVIWVGLSIISAIPVDLIISSSFAILSQVSKEYPFEDFPLKSVAIIETVELRLLMFIRMSRGPGILMGLSV